MTRLFLLGAFAVTGCTEHPPAEVPPPAVEEPITGPATFSMPGVAARDESSADLGGQALARAVAPDTPALPPVPRFGAAKHMQAIPARFLDPDPTTKPKFHSAPVLPTRRIGMRPAPPVERVPLDLGRGASAVPAQPKLPVAKVVTVRARDVKLPPALPALGRLVVDRVGLEDPTSELGNAAIVEPALKVPFVPAAFLKVVIPDPFELAEQIQPKIPPRRGAGTLASPRQSAAGEVTRADRHLRVRLPVFARRSWSSRCSRSRAAWLRGSGTGAGRKRAAGRRHRRTLRIRAGRPTA